MKKALPLLLVLALAASMLPAAIAERVSIPDVLRFTQKTTPRDYVRDQQYVISTYPTTANEKVNKEMNDLISQMEARGRANLPKGKIETLKPSYLNVSPTIYRTGSQWMSFLTIARIAYEREQTYVDFDARVYDMISGDTVKLSDLFSPDSEAWKLIADEVRSQLSLYFMTETADDEALNALCQREALENAAFTLTPAKIQLHYRADSLYPGKNTLMHVKLYHSKIRPFMNEKGREITDNSKYKMIALTYDDGGAKGSTMNLIAKLQQYGANATFFIVGTMMGANHYVMAHQHDAGYAMASHNWEHVYEDLTPENIMNWKARFDAAMDSIVGIRPEYMRAPGGHYAAFINANVGMSLIQWSINSSDAGNDNVAGIAATVKNNIHDGGIVLMHDINPKAYSYTETILEELEHRDYLCVTVDELFDHYGVPMEPNQMYTSLKEEAKAQ